MGVVVLGRVIIGDIAATLVDLSSREFLRVEETDGDSGGWTLTSLLESAPQHGGDTVLNGDTVLKYEQTLLEGLQGTSSLSALTDEFPAVLDMARTELIHDAVHRGWLKHIHHDERTHAGQDLAGRIHSFQRGLGHLQATGHDDSLTGALLPYALHFGMVSDSKLPLVRFAHAWVDAFRDLPPWSQPQPRPKPDFESRDLELQRRDTDEEILGRRVRDMVWLTHW
jgi:hypothetical protein